MALKKSDFCSPLWASCDPRRSGMDAALGEYSFAVDRVPSSQAALGIKSGPTLNRGFLCHWFQCLKPHMKLLSQQGVPSNLNAGMVRDFNLRLPRVEKQMATRTALANAEFTALERRPVKSRAIKTGMKQELLTGRTRLVEEGDA